MLNPLSLPPWLLAALMLSSSARAEAAQEHRPCEQNRSPSARAQRLRKQLIAAAQEPPDGAWSAMPAQYWPNWPNWNNWNNWLNWNNWRNWPNW